MDQIMQEQGMSMFGYTDGGSTGIKVKGVDYVVTGAVTEYGQQQQSMGFGNFAMSKTIGAMAVDIRLIKVSTGEILIAETAYSRKEGGQSLRTQYFNSGQGTGSGALLGEVMRDCANKVAALISSNIS